MDRRNLWADGILIGILVLFCLSQALCADREDEARLYTPYTGWVHPHTDYDDGEDSLQDIRREGLERGLDFAIVTPHANLIEEEVKEINLIKRKTGKVGFKQFIKECRENSDDKFRIIPGVEFGKTSHFLGLGIYDFDTFAIATNTELAWKTQENAILFLQSRGAVVIAAHPDLRRKHPKKSNPLQQEETKLIFDFKGAGSYADINNIDGVEQFNNGDDDPFDNIAKFYTYRFRLPVITAGCDFHTKAADLLAKRDSKSFLTVIWAKSNQGRDLLASLKLGYSAAVESHTKKLDKKLFPQNPFPQSFIHLSGIEDMVNHSVLMPEGLKGSYFWLYFSPGRGEETMDMNDGTFDGGRIRLNVPIKHEEKWFILFIKTKEYDMAIPQVIADTFGNF